MTLAFAGGTRVLMMNMDTSFTNVSFHYRKSKNARTRKNKPKIKSLIVVKFNLI